MRTNAAAGEQPLLDWLSEQRSAMLDLLEEIVNTDSSSYDKSGVDAVGRHICRFLDRHHIAYDIVPNERFGDAIRAAIGADANATILLMGHRDTVFPKGEASRRPFRIADGRAYGPGVADMKAGLVMNAFVLAAFNKFGGAPAPLVALFTSDEEIASPSSRALIEAEARRARAVFNAEPGRPSGTVVTSRKGGVFMRVEVTGKAAHSGGSFAQGISAIGELAHKIIALHALTDLAKGVTVNVGLISGGQTVNTVAPSATGEIDLRFVTPGDRTAAMSAIETIVAASYVPGTSAKLEITGEFLPVVKTQAGNRLFEHYRACAKDAGLDLKGEFTGGCADSGFSAAVGAPTLCGTGPVGGKAHTAEEYLEVDTIVPRAQALALAILRLGRG
jgi:glutamate carboxypeptidase